MAFINRDDEDIWGGKTAGGEVSNNGGGYGRHGSTSGAYGRHGTSSRGQGDDLLAEAEEVFSVKSKYCIKFLRICKESSDHRLCQFIKDGTIPLQVATQNNT